jgi:hypothetical protein
MSDNRLEHLRALLEEALVLADELNRHVVAALVAEGLVQLSVEPAD